MSPNAHPRKHAALESVIPKLLERAIPLWERVLSDTRRPLLPFRTKSKVEGSLPDCLFADTDDVDPDSDEEYETDIHEWLPEKDPKLPDAREKYTGDLDVMKTPTVSLKGTTIQRIIKLAHIVLIRETRISWQQVARRRLVNDITNTRWPQCSLALLRDGKRTYRFQFHIREPSTNYHFVAQC